MNHVHGMDVYQPFYYLTPVVPHLKLVQFLPTANDLGQAFVFAQVHENVHVVVIFKKAVELDHMLVKQLTMYLYLLHELLLTALLDEVLFVNDL